MNTISIHDAKTNLSKYIAAAKSGRTIFIGSFGNPEVMLIKIPHDQKMSSKQRDFSIAAGKITEHKDSFSKETDAQIQNLMYSTKD